MASLTSSMKDPPLELKVLEKDSAGEAASPSQKSPQNDDIAPLHDDVEQHQKTQDDAAKIDEYTKIPKSIRDYIDYRLEEQQKQIEKLKRRLSSTEDKLNFVKAENTRLKRTPISMRKSNSDTGEKSTKQKELRQCVQAAEKPSDESDFNETNPDESGTCAEVCTHPGMDPGVSPHNTYDIAWNTHFQNLQFFKKKYGHYNVYRGYSRVLCEWVSRQRRVLLGKKKGVMNAARLDALQRIGFKAISDDEVGGGNRESMEEDEPEDQVDLEAYPEGIPAKDYLDRQWNERFLALKVFRQEYGHCRVHPGYNKTLASWVVYQRQLYNGNKRGNQGETIGMDATRIAALTSLGMNWKHAHKGSKRKRDSDASEDEEYEPLIPMISSQKRMRADVQRPTSTAAATSPQEQQNERKIVIADVVKSESSEEKSHQPRISSSSTAEDRVWEANMLRLERFKKKKGHVRVTVFNDRGLFIWLNRQRRQHSSKGGLRQDRIDSLTKIGFDWRDSNARRADHSDDEENEKSEAVESESNSDTEDEVSEKDEEEPAVMESASADKENEEVQSSPNDAPFEIDSGVSESNPRDRIWNLHFQNLQRFKRKHGTFRISKAIDTVLQEWVSRQRLVYHGKKHGDLNQERLDALNRIGFEWSVRI